MALEGLANAWKSLTTTVKGETLCGEEKALGPPSSESVLQLLSMEKSKFLSQSPRCRPCWSMPHRILSQETL